MRRARLLVAGALLVGAGGWLAALGGDEQPSPAVAVAADPPHFSPGHSPGIHDMTRLVPAVEVQQAGAVINAYRLVISGEDGRPVRTMERSGEPIPDVVPRLLIDLGLQERASVAVPVFFTWDGRNDAGDRVPEGLYRFVLEVTDDFGNTGRSEPRHVMVDDTPPSVAVETEYLIFSPDGDGSRDKLPILQSGSSEVRWSGQFLDRTGTVVRTFLWTDGPPADFLWDGRDDDERVLPDGTYRYRMSARDLAGNAAVVTVDRIVIDTATRRLEIDVAMPAFSPNGDGVLDEMSFPVTIDAGDMLLDWTAEVRDADERLMRTMSGRGPVPQPLRFDGHDDEGGVIAEGAYTLVLSARYANGSTRVVSSPPFRLDVTPPDAFVQLHYDVVSPNGDGVRDVLLVTQEASGDGTWLVSIMDERGEPVWSEHTEEASDTFRWDGRDGLGTPVADGRYLYELSGRDGAGNEFSSGPLAFTVDTREATASLRAARTHFSPNGDGIQDTVEIVPELSVTDSIESAQPRDRRRCRHRLVSGSRPDGGRTLRVDGPGRRRQAVSGRRVLDAARGALHQRQRRCRRSRAGHAGHDVPDDRGEHGRPGVLARRRRRQGGAAHQAGVERRGAVGGALHRPGGRGGRHRELAGPGGRLPLGRHGRSGDTRRGRDVPVRGHGHGRRWQQHHRTPARDTAGHAADRGAGGHRRRLPDRRRRSVLSQRGRRT